MKAVVAAFNQEKALVGAFSVITNLRMELFGALPCTGLQEWIMTTSQVELLCMRIPGLQNIGGTAPENVFNFTQYLDTVLHGTFK